MAVYAGDHSDGGTDFTAVKASEHRPGGIRQNEVSRKRAHVEYQRRLSVLGTMQSIVGCAAADRTGDIQKIAIAVRARSENGVAEHHGVGLAPRDIGPGCGPVIGLVWRTSPTRLAAKLAIGLHHAARHPPRRLFEPDARTAGQVQRTDIQSGTDGDFRAALHQPFGKQGAGIAVVQRAVDMGRRDRDQSRRAEHSGGLGHDAHGHRRAIAPFAARCRAFFGRQDQRHSTFLIVIEVGRE